MRYIPHTPAERAEMLEALGISAVDDLFQDIPGAARLTRPLDLPRALSELELTALFEGWAAQDRAAGEWPCFLGGGFYRRFIPAAVPALAERGEFLTAYTPYQPELSQGTLAVIFEFQTMMAALAGLDAAQASLYDGSTAVAEAALLALNETGRPLVVVDEGVLPDHRLVVATYLRARGARLEGPPPGADLLDYLDGLTEPPAAVIVQQPDVMGVVRDYRAVAAWCRGHDTVAVAVADPVALAVVEPPGAMGFDVVVGEGQPLGNALQYGGPGFGFFAVRSGLVRKLPGRLVGMAHDRRGHRGFVLTLQAREQHIRREKATSNICSNHSLNALQATIYLSLLGPEGLREVARLSAAKAHYLAERLEAAGVQPARPGPFLFERAYRLPGPPAEMNRRLLARGILGGFDMGRWRSEWQGLWHVAVTEMVTREALDALAEEVAAWTSP
jgi:glycine dehydrogenase subunit 1